MGKRSIKENKNIYFVSRENAGLTREAASDKMEFISPDRIERIENEKSRPQPDEVLAMAKCYKVPNLCNYYCSHECEIGQNYVPEIQIKNLSQIVLEMVASLNTLDEQKNRLIEITVDGEISEDEYADFAKISAQLDKISMAVESMKMWVDKTASEGGIDLERLKAAK